MRFQGRLANQMFQWAFGFSYFKKTGRKIAFDASRVDEEFRLDCFKLADNIDLVEVPFYTIWLRKILKSRKFREIFAKTMPELPRVNEKTFYKYQEELFDIDYPAYFCGYYQSEKYFSEYFDEISKSFELKSPLSEKNLEILDKIKNSESVSLHVRRGDYVELSENNAFCKCSVEYYKNAVDMIVKELGKPIEIFVFSDDINWAKNNLKFDYEVVFVDNNSNCGYFDLELMKNCKHNVIANSSFSWWGAWLNNNSDKIVIAPIKWKNDIVSDYDLIPEKWFRIEL